MADPVCKLTINFRGICTHFWGGVIPGVQHRVVLVEAAQIRAVVIAPKGGTPVPDWLMPHVPMLQSANPNLALNALPMLQGDYFMMGSRLTVANGIPFPAPPATEGHVSYGPNFETAVLPVSGFTDNYAYSTDVVLAGRAAVYLDLFNGMVETSAPGPGVVVTVKATVYTNGVPTIRVAPFLADPANDVRDQLLVLPVDLSQPMPEASVTLSNSCSPDVCGPDGGSNDYLYHLLTDRGGLPRYVNPPAFKQIASPQTSPEVGLKKLRELGFPLIFPPAAMGGPGTLESCADSRYP